MPRWAGPCLSIVVSTHLIGKMEAILGGTTLSSRCFLKKNGGEGCHPGQDLSCLMGFSYKRMEE